ncbi:MAG: FlgD immunoglobulin-like domain containing protein [bacterium]
MRKSIFLFLSLFILVLGANSLIFSDDYSDTRLITWEKVNEPFFNKWNPYGVGARAMGMGEAFSAIADDASAVYYNPAGLAQMDHNELSWTGGSDYSSAPYTNFATFDMALGGQYFALSYLKLYHPIGRYPDKIVIPAPGVGPVPGNLYSTQPLFIPSGLYENWFGSLQASQQDLLAKMYRAYINLPFQENQVALTYATSLTSDKSFDFGINVKYQYTDAAAAKVLGSAYDAWAWSIDLGFLYKIRLIEFLKDFNIGIMLRDISGRAKYFNTGVEKPLYFTSTVALSMRTTELIENEITSLSVDWDAVNDAGVFVNEANRLKFGFEQWFIDGHFAVRSGLVFPMNQQPWRMSFGVSARYLLGIDYAYVRGIPFDAKAENEGDSHWLTLYWMWGKVARKMPMPDVFAAVEPISFSPRNGETAIFKVNATSKAGIDRWALSILDKNNNLVKTYVDIGNPPSQIVWNGSDNKYLLLPDGEYTFIFEATDKLGSTSSTPVQTVKIYTPVIEGVSPEALNKLRQLLNQSKDRDVAEDIGELNSAKKGVDDLKKAKAKPTPQEPPLPAAGYNTLPVIAGTPGVLGNGLTGTASPIDIVGFPNIDSGAIRSAYISTGADGDRQFNMDYVTTNTLPKYVIKEMSLMVKSIAESLGYSVDRIGINAIYGGNNNMNLSVPIAQAENYQRGTISVDQMLRGASINLNGEIIYPNF